MRSSIFQRYIARYGHHDHPVIGVAAVPIVANPDTVASLASGAIARRSQARCAVLERGSAGTRQTSQRGRPLPTYYPTTSQELRVILMRTPHGLSRKRLLMA